MMTAMSACPTCGGELPDALYRRTIACPYCSASVPNPTCLHVGDEVLMRGMIGLEITRVTKCDGPDSIAVVDNEAVLRLEDLIPVTRATEDLASGTSVYRRNAIAWSITYTASRPHGATVKVKNEGAAFQDAFFDESAELVDIRLDARSKELGGVHDKRTAVGALVLRFRDSPISTLFDLGFKAMFGLIFVVVAFVLLRAFVF